MPPAKPNGAEKKKEKIHVTNLEVKGPNILDLVLTEHVGRQLLMWNCHNSTIWYHFSDDCLYAFYFHVHIHR